MTDKKYRTVLLGVGAYSDYTAAPLQIPKEWNFITINKLYVSYQESGEDTWPYSGKNFFKWLVRTTEAREAKDIEYITADELYDAKKILQNRDDKHDTYWEKEIAKFEEP